MTKHGVRILAIGVVALVATLGLTISASGRDARTATAGSAKLQAKTKLPMKTIGIMGPVDAAEIIKLGTDSIDAAAKALGWKTIRVDPGGDPAKMASGMNSLVDAKVDAIVLWIIEPATIQAGLRAAKRAGIPVINTGSATHPSPLIAGYYWPSPQAENAVLITKAKQSLPRGSEIGSIQLPQFYNALITEGLFTKSAKTQGWKIVARHDSDLSNLVPDVKKSVGDMIRANPEIDAIWGCCDFAVAGAIPAIQQSGKKVALYSMHGVPSSIQFVKNGNAFVQVSNYQLASFAAIDVLAKWFTQKTPIPKATPKAFPYKMTLIDKNTKAYPYPTSQLLAQFKARWGRMYTKAGG